MNPYLESVRRCVKSQGISVGRHWNCNADRRSVKSPNDSGLRCIHRPSGDNDRPSRCINGRCIDWGRRNNRRDHRTHNHSLAEQTSSPSRIADDCRSNRLDGSVVAGAVIGGVLRHGFLCCRQ